MMMMVMIRIMMMPKMVIITLKEVLMLTVNQLKS